MESMCEEKSSQVKRAGKFFSKLPPYALENFSLIEHPSSYAANKVLFREGDAVKTIFVILEGEVRLSVHSKEGRRLCLSIASPGDIVGLSSALTETPSDMTAETLFTSKIAVIGRREFLSFLTNNPAAYQSVTEELGRHMSLACSQLRNLGLSASAPERLARLLLEWSDRSHVRGTGSRIRISMTHEEIGDFIGTSRETVTRTLSNFKSRRLVAFQGSVMTIPSRTALAAYAHV